jgi:hypothetical protein
MTRFGVLCGVNTMLAALLAWEFVGQDQGGAGADGALPPSVIVAADITPQPQIDADALGVLAKVTIARPLFARSRRPRDEPEGSDAVAKPSDDPPRLAGVLIWPAGARAIFALPDGKSRVAAEGDAISEFRVRSIEPGVVTLSGSAGDRILRPAYAPRLAGGKSDADAPSLGMLGIKLREDARRHSVD